ncbi:2-hydroxymuconate tautomerase family protein [Thalassotalea fusca]
MPYINVKITDENVSQEQKQAIIKGCTSLMVDILDKDPATTFVIIDEVNTDNWGIGYEQVTALRTQLSPHRSSLSFK